MNLNSEILNPKSKIGLVAGWGRFPIVVAQSLKALGYEVHCVGLAGHADPGLAEICDSHVECGVARMGQHVRYFRSHGVTQATLAGKLFKDKLLFGRWGWLSLVPDLTTIRAFFPVFIQRKQDRRDDTLLTVVVDAFARCGITMAPATDFTPDLLAKAGRLTRRGPTAGEQLDITFGWGLAKAIGRLDIGQSVAVKGRAVIAVEAVEGTDACIRRAGELCPQGGFTVVKVAKPQQDMRFDVPTIGIGTIESLMAAGASVLAVEAGKTIVVDRDEVVALADKHGLAIVALDSGNQAVAAPGSD
ncbi:MAG: UDP-2,3-diacylglucosamine diphosphatase LpxI [Planctomycetaceae bacterium]|nr:UDP-2,3-diacylglucosamine diphosphatase LpxI [Planctomycetaceae bacterium]